jgi:hypothetical protein
MICCVTGCAIIAFLLAARRFVRVRVLGGEDAPDPAEWRLTSESS